MHETLRQCLLDYGFAPVKVVAIGTDSNGDAVVIPMRATSDGGLISAPLGTDASVVGLLVDGRFVELPG